MDIKSREPKAFLKCVGGKFKLIPQLSAAFPKDLNKFDTYLEPFLGGGAVLLYMLSKYPNLWSEGGEYNDYIADLWKFILEAPEFLPQFILELEERKQSHSEEFFYKVRSKINKIKSLHTDNTYPHYYNISALADFLYFNKTAFNGLIRFNSKGELNSPWGKYKNPGIYNKENLELIASFGRRAKVYREDFQKFLESADERNLLGKKTFVYLDPPYIPKSTTANFVNYTSDGFGIYDQVRLLSTLYLINSRGAKFMLSNSDTELTRKLFKDWNIQTITAARSINCKKDKRGKISELLITNY